MGPQSFLDSVIIHAIEVVDELFFFPSYYLRSKEIQFRLGEVKFLF